MVTILKKIISKEWHLGIFDNIEEKIENMRLAEKSLWYIAFFVFGISAFIMLSNLNNRFLVEIPSYGGTMTEAIVGTPRFINPLLSVSDADRDLASLIYSGLMKKTSNGDLIPDLAESFSVSPDGLTYTFKLRPNLTWSDGETISTKDIAFTILKAQDPELKSYRRVNWEGVTVNEINDTEISFTLIHPYAPFIESTTMGILPKHIWEKVSTDEFPFSQWNIEPVGSGPFKVKSISRNNSSVPNSYKLTPQEEYALGRPFIENFIINFYPNEKSSIDAYNKNEATNVSGISPNNALSFLKDEALRNIPLTRLFGVFFNQNQDEALLDKGARKALAIAIDKNDLIEKVLLGFGTVVDSPVLDINSEEPLDTTSASDKIERARAILSTNDWEQNEESGVWEKKINKQVRKLSLSLSTSNIPELVETAHIIEKTWKDLGVEVDTRVFETSDLNQNVIRPRKYDALLFGTVVTSDADLYAFWHSSQRNDPGLNIAMYTNSKADESLEIVRKTNDPIARLENLEKFKKEIDTDIPAIFIYAPEYIYLLSPEVKNAKFGTLSASSDRFADIHKWYIKTDKVWSIFSKK